MQGPSAGAEELFEESIGVSCPTSQPTHLATVFDLSPFQVPYTTFFNPRQPDFYPLSFHNNWGAYCFYFLGESNQTSPSDTEKMQKETSVYLCLWAGSFHSGQQEPFPAARSKHWDTGEAGGVRTKMLVWEPACHSLLSLSSPYPLLPLFQSSDFSSLSFIYHFLQNVKLLSGVSQRSIILLFSLLSFKLYCVIMYIITKANITIFKISLIYRPCF